MEKTLTENGIEDEDPEFEKLGIEASQWYIPTIHLFFSDDLTFAWFLFLFFWIFEMKINL